MTITSTGGVLNFWMNSTGTMEQFYRGNLMCALAEHTNTPDVYYESIIGRVASAFAFRDPQKLQIINGTLRRVAYSYPSYYEQ